MDPTVTYAGTIQDDAPIGYWRLDETAGATAADSSGNGNNGVISGGITYAVTPGALVGDPDSAMGFDGANGWNASSGTVSLSLPEVNTDPGGTNTVEFWMNWNGAGNYGMPFSFLGYDLYLLNGAFGFNTGQGDLWATSSAGMVNRWVYVVAMFNNGDARQSVLYIDGIQQVLTQRLGTTGSAAVTTGDAQISGTPGDRNYQFPGRVDEVAVYSGTLPTSRVRYRYALGHTGTAPSSPSPPSGMYANAVLNAGPIAYWRMDETSGVLVADASGHGNDGVMTGGVTTGVTPGALAEDADTAMGFNGLNRGCRVVPAGFEHCPRRVEHRGVLDALERRVRGDAVRLRCVQPVFLEWPVGIQHQQR